MKKTYLINIDGTRADYLDAIGHQGHLTPTLRTLAQKGIRYTNCKCIMPANTGTNHTAIMTGTHAGTHGILGAVGYYKGLDFNHPKLSKKYGQPNGGFYKHSHLQTPTFFNTIKKHNPNLVTAFIPSKTWVANIIADEDCDITIYPGNTQENCDQHQPNPDYVTPSEGYVLGGPPHPEDTIFLPRFYIPKKKGNTQPPPETITFPLGAADADSFPSDQWVIEQATRCIDRDNPDFMYIILMNMDFAGHIYGAPSAFIENDRIEIQNLCSIRNPAATRDQLYITDQVIKQFIKYLKKQNLYENARIIFTADHGMNLLKGMFTGLSRKNLFYWALAKRNIIEKPLKKTHTNPKKLIEELDIDIRRILAKHGIKMRASQLSVIRRYNPQGHYEWCSSDGGPVGYIYNANPTTQEKIKQILLNYTVKENERRIHPVWKVLIERDMDDEINEYTNEPFHLEKGAFSSDYDHVWPSVIIFLRPHYFIPLYNDQVRAGLTPLKLSMKIPGFIDVRSGPGSHGSYLEQNVPLIFISPSESEIVPATLDTRQVSVLDILPTITVLNSWKQEPTFEGKSLIDLDKTAISSKPEISVTIKNKPARN